MLQWLKKIVPEPRVPEIGGSSPGCTETAATRARRPAPQNPRSPSSRFAPHSLGHKRHDERGEFPGWAGDTLSRSGRTLLPFDPGLPQECPPLARMSPESACPLKGVFPAVRSAAEIPLWPVSRLTQDRFPRIVRSQRGTFLPGGTYLA